MDLSHGLGDLATLLWEETFGEAEQKEREQSLKKHPGLGKKGTLPTKSSCMFKELRRKGNEHKICKISNV